MRPIALFEGALNKLRLSNLHSQGCLAQESRLSPGGARPRLPARAFRLLPDYELFGQGNSNKPRLFSILMRAPRSGNFFTVQHVSDWPALPTYLQSWDETHPGKG